MRVAIIGVGSQGFKYAKLIKDSVKELKIVAFVRISEDKFKYFADSNIKVYNEVNELLSDFDNEKIYVDSFIITSPHKSHKEITISAFNRGINVLLEKPITVSLSEAIEISNSYTKNKNKYPNLLFDVIYQNRLLPINKYLKDTIESKKYGRILSVNYINNGFFRPHEYFRCSKWRGNYETEGGALLINQASHSIDLIYYLFNLPLSVFSNIKTQIHNISAEDYVSTIFKYDNFNINYTSSLNDPFNTSRLEIIFEEAKILIENNKVYLSMLDKKYQDYLNETSNLFIKPRYNTKEIVFESNDPYRDLFISFANRKTICGMDAIYSLYMINATTLSSYMSKEIMLSKDSNELEEFARKYDTLLNNLVNLNEKSQ